MHRFSFCTILFFFLFSFYYSFGQERILDYSSDITINPDASMLVIETITVSAEGIKIKRGIYRDFPTKYKDTYGNTYIVGFNIVEILRDGEPDDFRIENISNGKRVYIGDKDYYLTKGIYTYTIIYKTNRQIGFFNDHDELYWNVTGNGWDFYIEKASAKINLPSEISPDKITCFAFTGPSGYRNRNYGFEKEISTAYFFTTKLLDAKEGLTIVVEWPKGFVNEPSSAAKIKYFIKDNLNILLGVIGIFTILLFYLFVWNKVGKDPEKGTIIPQYSPPDNFSPAAMRFIKKMQFDNKAFAVSIINMAVKGYLSINESEGKFTLIKSKAGLEVLNEEEKRLASKLKFNSERSAADFSEIIGGLNNRASTKNYFAKKIVQIISNNIIKKSAQENSVSENEPERISVLELDQKNHSIISYSIKELKGALKKSYEKIYFLNNRKEFTIGVLLSVLFIASMGITGSPDQLFLIVWLSIWSLGVTVLINAVVKAWEGIIQKGKLKFSGLISTLFITGFSLPFVAGELAGIYFLSQSEYLVPVILAAQIFINILFYHLLKAPTLAGRKLLDKIEGFKMFLSTTEKDRYNLIHNPEKTPELFEKYLPYALALDVENNWAEQFSDVLNKSSIENSSYHPGWYSGPNWNSFNPAGFTSSLGSSFSNAISSSSSAPGSSSGSGGSSGGGGGGGGGGGW